MRTSTFTKWASLLFANALCFSAALAHDGHGPEGAHWHATDLFGFLIAALVVVYVIWKSRK